MKKIITLSLVIIVLLICIFSFIKVNTNIYVGNYSYYYCGIDIQLKIDNRIILNDSLFNRPYPSFILKEKLRFGYHKVNISSKRAGVTQEKTIYLLPNQHIYIEFLSADTLCFEERLKSEKIFLSNNSANDESLFFALDTIIFNEQSRFRVESSFNPFYIE